MYRQKKIYIIYSFILTVVFLLYLSGGILKSNTTMSTFSSMEQLPQLKYNDDRMEILGFYTEPEPPLSGSYGIMQQHSGDLTYIAPFYYRIGDKSGRVEKWHGITDAQVKNVVDSAHKKNVRVLALVHNLLYGQSGVGRQVAHQVLQDAQSRGEFITSLLATVQSADFDGVNIDIEDINYSDRDNFSALVRETKKAFESYGLLVTVSVPPETGQLIPGSWARNFDYKEIGKWADRVAVMTYDEHGYVTSPGPVASTKWVDKVIKYTVSVIPQDKVLLGIPAYGFDWTVDKRSPRYLSYKLAMDVAGSNGVKPEFDQVGEVPYITYAANGEKHQVWFEDARSFKIKADLARKWGLRGLAIWRLGMEDPAIWKSIGRDFTVAK